MTDLEQLFGVDVVRKCPWNWGSHGCGLDYLHEGNHQCISEEYDDPCHEVAQDGDDGSGFKWTLYGGEEVDWVHPSWSEAAERCPACAYSSTLICPRGSDGTYHCCRRCGWVVERQSDSPNDAT